MKTQTGHTPGPWAVSSGTLVVRDGAIVANCLNIESISPTSDLNELEANARLIAAAPCLLEALSAMVLACKYQNIELAGLDMAKQAINKATGKGLDK